MDRNWLLGVAAVGIVLGGAAQDLTVSVLSSPKTVEPGDLVTHVFSLANESAAPLEVALEADLPSGWVSLGLPQTLTIPAGQEEVVFLTAAVPGDAPAGDYTLSLRARWDEKEAQATAQVRVASVVALEVLAPRGEAVPPGQAARYTFQVINRGNVVDRVLTEATSAHGWPVTCAPMQLSLAPGERAEVEVTVKVPLDAHAGRDLLTFLVRSSTAPAVERSVTLFTTVLPPTPELISGTHLAELRMRAGVGFDIDPMTLDWGARFDLAGLGTVLKGGLSFGCTLVSPNSQGGPEVRDWSFTYTREGIKVLGADVRLLLTPLLTLDTQGLGVQLDDVHGAELAFASGKEGGAIQAGGKIGFTAGSGRLGMAFWKEFGEESGWATCAFGGWEANEWLRLRLEGGVSQQDSFLDSAILATVVAEKPPLFRFQFDGYSVGPHFPTSWPDREGLTLSGRVGTQTLSFRYSIRHFRDNVWHVPSLIPVVTSELSSTLDWSLKELPLALFFDFEVARVREGTLTPSTDQRSHRTGFGLSGTAQSVGILLQVDRELDEDLVLGTTLTTFKQRLAIRLKQAFFSLSLTQKVPGQGSASAAAEFSFGTTGPPPRFHLHWEHARSGGSASLEADWATGDGPSWTFSADLAWDGQGQVTGLRLGAGFNYTFRWHPPFLPVRGWLAGLVFIDQNGNHVPDEGEPGVSGAVLVADGVRVATNEKGEFLFPPLDPGTYALSLEGLPVGVRPAVDLPLSAEVTVGKRTVLAIPCLRLGEIDGVVFDDLNQDGKQAPDEPGIAGVAVVLIQKGEVLDRMSTDAAGRFLFSLLPPGTYTIRVDVNTLPERYELTTPEEMELEVVPGQPSVVAFGAYKRPRPVIITYQPPFADFVWSPETPHAGEEVEFDGTGSVDFDGKIVAYAWDFDGDGRPDAHDPIVHWTFPEPGTYRVSLTVTDDSGLTDTLELEVEVAP
ncbi:PKD domain-containing protein [Candidatus Bipolaricaulota bacterium]|nr:PKD domain-containing protein [Candidatus Bipolaricaulota bacterium]